LQQAVRPHVFGRKDYQSDYQKKHALQHGEKEADDSQRDEYPPNDQDERTFSDSIHDGSLQHKLFGNFQLKGAQKTRRLYSFKK
jgi:hypothetical protein